MMELSETAQRLVLVRHGETEWTEKGLLHGRLDIPLNAAGIKHAKQTAARLQGESFDAIFTSPLSRAVQTAEVIGEPHGLKPIALDGLREMDFGWSEGKPLHLIEPDGAGPRLHRQIARFAMAVTAERPNRFAARVKSALETVQASYPQGRVLIVAHWGVLSTMMALLFDGNLRRWKSFGPWAACGITELHHINNSWQVACLNDQTHIQENSFIGLT
jgi:broad specificity phosphatase PhoE